MKIKTNTIADTNVSAKLEAAWDCMHSGNLGQAESLCKSILQEDDSNAEAWNLYGIMAARAGQQNVAAGYIGKAVGLNEKNPAYLNNLGIVFKEQGRLMEAEACLEQALLLDPSNASGFNNLGTVLQLSGRLEAAAANYEKALEVNPEFIDALINLGGLLAIQRKFEKALEILDHGLRLAPASPDIYNNIGSVYKDLNRLDQAIECFEKALILEPSHRDANANLGHTLRDRGELERAIEIFRNLQKIYPNFSAGHSALVQSLLYWQSHNGLTTYEEHREWVEQHALKFRPSFSIYPNTVDVSRKLHIGYVSNDFRNHATAFFIEPVLEEHDRSNFEITCYSTSNRSDVVSERLSKLVDNWRNVSGISDEVLFQLIRDDKVDILVDLMGHTVNHRLNVFAMKPAPLQVTWLGYPHSTALDTIDYWIVDRYVADPNGMTEQPSSEELFFLPDFYMCFRPTPKSPEIGSLPAIRNGYVTFGSFNSFVKITPAVIELWAKVLRSVPNSHLVMLTVPEGEAQARVNAQFESYGINSKRVEMVGRLSHDDFLRLHHAVDIALDPFPYNGTTTTLHGFWMGVPIVTLAGKSFVSRVGLSLLSNLGLPELIANTPDEYVEIARNLANDLSALHLLRSGLRDKMMQSPLVDKSQFTLNLEQAYRTMWERWCAEKGVPAI